MKDVRAAGGVDLLLKQDIVRLGSVPARINESQDASVGNCVRPDVDRSA